MTIPTSRLLERTIKVELRALRAYSRVLRSNWHRDATPRRLSEKPLPGWKTDFEGTNRVAALCGEVYRPFGVLKMEEAGDG